MVRIAYRTKRKPNRRWDVWIPSPANARRRRRRRGRENTAKLKPQLRHNKMSIYEYCTSICTLRVQCTASYYCMRGSYDTTSWRIHPSRYEYSTEFMRCLVAFAKLNFLILTHMLSYVPYSCWSVRHCTYPPVFPASCTLYRPACHPTRQTFPCQIKSVCRWPTSILCPHRARGTFTEEKGNF